MGAEGRTSEFSSQTVLAWRHVLRDGTAPIRVFCQNDESVSLIATIAVLREPPSARHPAINFEHMPELDCKPHHWCREREQRIIQEEADFALGSGKLCCRP